MCQDFPDPVPEVAGKKTTDRQRSDSTEMAAKIIIIGIKSSSKYLLSTSYCIKIFIKLLITCN